MDQYQLDFELELGTKDRKMSNSDPVWRTPMLRPLEMPFELPEPLTLPPNISEFADKGNSPDLWTIR